MDEPFAAVWSLPTLELLQRLRTEPKGLTDEEARKRLGQFGRNLLQRERKTDLLTLLISQFKSPIILILLFAAGLSLLLGDRTDTVIILAIVLASGLLGFWQERGAADAVEKLLAVARVRATVTASSGKCQSRRSCRAMSCCFPQARASPAIA